MLHDYNNKNHINIIHNYYKNTYPIYIYIYDIHYI